MRFRFFPEVFFSAVQSRLDARPSSMDSTASGKVLSIGSDVRAAQIAPGLHDDFPWTREGNLLMHTTRRTFLHLSGGAAAAARAASRAATAPGASVEVLASAVGTLPKLGQV